MQAAFSIDPDQGLSERDELDLVRVGAALGYVAAWTPSRADAAAFERCLRWHEASGLPSASPPSRPRGSRPRSMRSTRVASGKAPGDGSLSSPGAAAWR